MQQLKVLTNRFLSSLLLHLIMSLDISSIPAALPVLVDLITPFKSSRLTSNDSSSSSSLVGVTGAGDASVVFSSCGISSFLPSSILASLPYRSLKKVKNSWGHLLLASCESALLSFLRDFQLILPSFSRSSFNSFLWFAFFDRKHLLYPRLPSDIFPRRRPMTMCTFLREQRQNESPRPTS